MKAKDFLKLIEETRVLQRRAGVEIEQPVVAARPGIVIHHHVDRSILSLAHRSRGEGRALDAVDRLNAVQELLFGSAPDIIPFVKDAFGMLIPERIQNPPVLESLVPDGRQRRIDVPGKEIQRHVFSVGGERVQETVEPNRLTEQRRTADLEVRKTFFEVRRRGFIQFEKLFRRALPGGAAVFARRIVRLVPDLPVFDVHGKTVRPAFVVMTDDMFADHRPFLKIGRHARAVFFRCVLNLGTQTVEDAAAGGLNPLQITIGLGKVIGRRVGGVARKIRKDRLDIDGVFAAVAGKERRVVIPHAGEFRRPPRVHVVGPAPRLDRTVVDRVHRFDRTDDAGRIDGHGQRQLGMSGAIRFFRHEKRPAGTAAADPDRQQIFPFPAVSGKIVVVRGIRMDAVAAGFVGIDLLPVQKNIHPPVRTGAEAQRTVRIELEFVVYEPDVARFSRSLAKRIQVDAVIRAEAEKHRTGGDPLRHRRFRRDPAGEKPLFREKCDCIF